MFLDQKKLFYYVVVINNATIDLNSEHINCKKKEKVMRFFISRSGIALVIYILSSIAVFTANGSDFLPSGWVMYSSEGKSYYYNQQTGVTQWERPLGTSPSNRDQNSGVLFINISLYYFLEIVVDLDSVDNELRSGI
jgi:hypothetical protein